MNIAQALTTLRPGAQWTLVGNELSGLTWLDTNQTAPTQSEIDVEIARLLAAYTANQYQRDRQRAYPAIEDQLDVLYHGGYDAWKASVKAVKDQFPKT